MPEIPQKLRSPVCITCGLPAGEPAQLNRMVNGQVCPTCRDRLLDAIPAPFSSLLRAASSPVEHDVEVSGRETHVDGEHRPWPPLGLGR